MKQLLIALLFLVIALRSSGQTTEPLENTPSNAVVLYTKQEHAEMNQAFERSFFPPEIFDFVVNQPEMSLYNLSIVCKKFNAILKPYCCRFIGNEFEEGLFDVSPNVLSLSWQIGATNTHHYLWQKYDSKILGMTRLTYLKIESCSIFSPDKFLPDDSISSLTNLRFLTATRRVTDEGIRPLKNLTFLDLSLNCCVTGAGIEGLTNLTYLDASAVNGMTKEAFKSLTNLTHLDLSSVGEDCIYGSQAIHHFDLSPLRELRFLDLCNTGCLFDDHLKFLTNLTTLHIVDAFFYDGFKDGLISHCGEKNHRTYEKFDIDAILSLPNLTELVCNYELIHYGLEKLTKLKILALCHRKKVFVGDITVQDIGCLTTLEKLFIEEYRPQERWKRNTYPIITELWKHKLMSFNGGRLPERSLTNIVKSKVMREMAFSKPKCSSEHREDYGLINFQLLTNEEWRRGVKGIFLFGVAFILYKLFL